MEDAIEIRDFAYDDPKIDLILDTLAEVSFYGDIP